MTSPDAALSGDTLRESATAVGRIVHRRLPGGLRLPSHTHHFSVLTVVIRGGFTETVRRTEQPCVPGAVRLLPAGDPHSNRSSALSECLQIELAPDVVDRATDATGAFALAGAIEGELVGALGRRLLQEASLLELSDAATLEMIVLDALSHAGRRAAARNRKRPPWLERVHEAVRAHHVEGVSLATLAEVAGVHPVHVAREFHRHFGCTLGDHVRRLRLERACGLMSDRRLTLAAIAAESGFSDQSHLVSLFRRYLGTTPRRYRRLLLGELTGRRPRATGTRSGRPSPP